MAEARSGGGAEEAPSGAAVAVVAARQGFAGMDSSHVAVLGDGRFLHLGLESACQCGLALLL